MNNRLKDLNNSVNVFIGQDSNAKVGVSNMVDEAEIVGKHGATKIYNKGRQLLDFLSQNDLMIDNTFLEVKNALLTRALMDLNLLVK